MAAGSARSGVLGKRHADDSNLNDSERFIAKRLHLLSMGSNAVDAKKTFYLPVPNAPVATASSNRVGHALAIQSPPAQRDDIMQVDETRDRVYIHDLDEDLADAISEDEKLIFLPDIEKKLTRIPKQVLQGTRDNEHNRKELVLYTVPKSLTVDERHDSVRKAIVEARQRAREEAVERVRQEDMDRKYDQAGLVAPTETAHGYGSGYAEEPDPDAMDLG